jgi:hypothetical protein
MSDFPVDHKLVRWSVLRALLEKINVLPTLGEMGTFLIRALRPQRVFSGA